MGTKIQCKTYLPGFCSMSDLNNNGTNTPWLLNHENKSRKRSQCTDSVLSPQAIDGYFECDKEKMRQTILKHETIFRHQLHELHRLYRRQRDLMNEHQRKEMLNSQTKTFQSSPSLSHVGPPDIKKTWQMSHFPSLDSIAGHLSTKDASKNQSSFGFIENDSRSIHFSPQVTKSSKECGSHQPDSSFFQRKMFNSRYVVDECMNHKEEHTTRKQWGLPCIQGNPVEGIYQIPPSRDAKTPVASALEYHADADLDRANSKKRTNELADLNKTLPLEEAPPLVPDINASSMSCLENGIYHGAKFSPKLPKERIDGICLNHPPCRNGEEQLTFKLNAGQKQPDNGSSGRLKTAEDLPFQSSQGHELYKHSLFKETKNENQRKRTIFGVEIHEDNQIQSASFSNVQTSTDKSQPLSQSYTELLRDLEAYRGNMHMSSDVRSHPSPKNVPPYQNVLCKRSQLNAKEVRDCSAVGLDFASGMTLEHCYPKQDWTRTCNRVNDMDCKTSMLKNDKETSCVSQTEAAGETPVYGDFQRKQEKPRETLPWLVGKSQESAEQTKVTENCYHLNLDSLQNYSKQFFRREDTGVNSSQFIDQGQGTLLSRSTRDSECQKVEVSDSTKIRTIFGVPIFSASKDSDAARALSKATFHDVDGVTATSISRDETVCRKQVEDKNFVQEKGLNGCISGLRYQIDLNLSLDEEEAPSAPPLPRAVVRIATTEIDLEAPAVLESEAECGNSKHTLEEANKLSEEAVRVAAESIISLSTSGVNGETNDVLQTELSDCLKWFAELVSSHSSGQECLARKISSGTVSEFDEESIPDGFDYFEFMTLKLEHMKEEEYSYKMLILESHKNEETVATTSPKRPRRGQPRRGRQRKDFQRDVLPGLISLSRYEVNKDILTFEELFKASGSSWQSSLSHRKTGKSGRGRRRLANADPSPTIPADRTPPVFQPCSSELGLEEKSLTGWGKRTRRLPRQRYLNSNLALPLKQC
ncbi:hypothetical protein HAX54_027171 [Datura stramonium]|uniref:Uncharacterized protein n=1 Tax=Datura stramonium TaxID=4076 RepID=A0ABS8RKN5_DATST|nr:hypothetical protein [Datura stramonium]